MTNNEKYQARIRFLEVSYRAFKSELVFATRKFNSYSNMEGMENLAARYRRMIDDLCYEMGEAQRELELDYNVLIK